MYGPPCKAGSRSFTNFRIVQGLIYGEVEKWLLPLVTRSAAASKLPGISSTRDLHFFPAP